MNKETEERFREEFTYTRGEGRDKTTFIKGSPEQFLAFITSELLLQRSEIIQQIEGIDRKEHICRFNDGEQKCDCYYEALNDVVFLLQPNKTI